MDDESDSLDLDRAWKVLRPPTRGRPAQLEGERFGRLLVLERAGTDKFRASTWRCGCDCGKEVVVSRPNLVGGRVKSCGCKLEEYRRSPKHKQMKAARQARRRLERAPRVDTEPVDIRDIAARRFPLIEREELPRDD